ncbi:hypothetical protein J2Z44_000782 [Clostridium punense]|uniref:DUF1836 domain-containing protein n=1 Tax=Clostridium punense TaxID=1054297 RepID=A0ABS4JZN3_9CLOT|nr:MULTISPECIES: DUF1836 domain-containing protein [Clostridium]EQB87028.1 hypothetical protein M918_11120 [Clostridium sp. BL8]MBP2020998.1 hypothetical protein [Clostridium punense]
MEFNKEELIEILNVLNLEEDIELIDIPQLDLYMDQVIQLFENTLSNSKRNKEDKLLTKTMINNYTKDKLLMPVKNKKYSRNHVILMILIYNLKQSLSISDIKVLFNNIVSNLQQEEKAQIDLASLYSNFLKIKKEQVRNEEEVLSKIINEVEEVGNQGNNKDYESLLLTVLTLVHSANTQRRIAEKIIDKYFI